MPSATNAPIDPQVIIPSGDILNINRGQGGETFAPLQPILNDPSVTTTQPPGGQIIYPILTFLTTTTPFPVQNHTGLRPNGLEYKITTNDSTQLVISNAFYSRQNAANSGITDFKVFNPYYQYSAGVASNRPISFNPTTLYQASATRFNLYSKTFRNL